MNRLACTFLVAGVAFAGLSGCTSTPGKSPDLAGADLAGVDLVGGSCNYAAYPPGPYGVTTNDVVANLQFTGKRDTADTGNVVNGAQIPIALGDYHSNPKDQVLAILVSAEWCLPCQAEQPELVQLWNGYKASNSGVAFLEFIVQNEDNSPGNIDTLDRWATKFKIPFDMAADLNNVLAPYYNSADFPTELVLTTCDMQIQAMRNGYQMGWLKGQIDPLVGQ